MAVTASCGVVRKRAGAKTGEKKAESEVVEIAVPALIEEAKHVTG